MFCPNGGYSYTPTPTTWCVLFYEHQRTLLSDYFFGHLWSLAFEEQFYLLWPTVIYLLPIPRLKKLVIGIIMLIPLLRLGMAFMLPMAY